MAYKLCVRFIGDYVQPEDPIVLATAVNFLANDTEIAPTLRRLFQSEDFKASAGLKASRPFEFIAGTLRAAGIEFDPLKVDRFRVILNTQLAILG